MYKLVTKTVIISLLILCLCSCSLNAGPINIDASPNTDGYDFGTAASKLSYASGLAVTDGFLKNFGEEITSQLVSAAESNNFSEKTWLDITGWSYHVVSDILSGNYTAENIKNCGDNGKPTFNIAFAGDILLDKNFNPMVHAGQMGGVINCIDKSVVKYLNDSDVFLINNEFSVGERGERQIDKTWTFQVAPYKLQVLKDLGADIVSLANNHVYDFGEVGFLDTMDSLKKAGIPYIGAGNNIDEASKPYFFVVNGIKVGIVAASCAEKSKIFTQVANENTNGIMGTYDSKAFVNAIKKADSQCDILIAYVHWGTESTTVLDKQQKDLAREYIDAGVDAVIGGHPHCLQGMEFYKNVPIIYSVGNFWFNSKPLDSCVITLEIGRDASIKTKIMPLRQENCEVHYLSDAKESRALFDRVESYEPQGVKIDNNGVINPK